MKILGLILAALLVPAAAGGAFAQSPEEKGYAIAKRAKDLTDQYTDFVADGRMTVRTRTGREAERRFTFKARTTSEGIQALLVFNWPGDVRGTGLLTIGKSGRNDDQWVFLPAPRLVKRVNSASRSRAFVGSEFSYEDMVEPDLEDFDYRWIRDEACCHVIEAHPRFSSAYERQVMWFEIKSGLPVQIEFFPRRGSKQKVLSISSYSNYGGVWRPRLARISNFQTGKSTELTWSNYRFDVGLRGSEFTPRALERVN
jgi:outer membrane lipoprotein-sorting protein